MAFRSPVLWLGLALFAPFAALLAHPAGRILGDPDCDNPSMFYFINAFAGRCWRAGDVPLWNPHIMLGLPFLGEGQAAIFHPLSWLFIALPTGVAIDWLIALGFLLSGLFFYGWLRAIELSVGAAAGGALVWSFSTILSGRIYAGHLTILLELIEVPLILMFWELYRRRRKIEYLLGLAVAYGAMILAAYPQVLYIFSLFLLLYVSIQSAPELLRRATRRAEARALGLLGAFVLLGIGIGAVQLLPTADFAGQSGRAKPALEFCWSYPFPPENMVAFVVPRFFGYTSEDGPAFYWGRHNYWEACIYIGILPLLLVLPGVLAAPRRRRTALLVCAVFFTAIALGSATPLFELLYRALPGFKYFRGPSKYMLATQLCLVTFSAYGIEALLHPPAERARRRLLIAALAAVALMLVAAGLLYASLGTHLFTPAAMEVPAETVRARAGWAGREVLRALVFIVLALGVLLLGWRAPARWRRALPLAALALALADLLWIFLPMLQKYDEKLTEIPESFVKGVLDKPYPARVLSTTLFANMALRYGFASASGYSGNSLGRYNTFVNAALDLPLDTLQVDDPIPAYGPPYRFLAFDYAMLPERELPPKPEVLAREPPMFLVRFPQPFPRAFLAAAPCAVASESEALLYVRTPSCDVLASPAVERADLAGVAPAPLGPAESARIVAFTANRVELEVRAGRPRVLVLCEAFEKNWTATVGGAPARIFPANYLFRGVVAPAGPSRVVFEYRPGSFRRGAAISLLSLCGAAGIGLGGWRGRRRRMRNAECEMRN